MRLVDALLNVMEEHRLYTGSENISNVVIALAPTGRATGL
jgi:hypothetical protein